MDSDAASYVAERHSFRAPIGVCVLLRRGDGALLLLKRAGTGHSDGAWCPPGGHVERGEGLIATAIREVREEIGLDLEPEALQVVHAIYQRDQGDGSEYVIFIFEALRWQGEAINREPERCAEMRWAQPGALPDRTIPFLTDALLQAYAGKSFSMHGW